MNRSPETLLPEVQRGEMERRIADYRRMGFDRKAMPHVVYHPPWDICPWPGCGFRIAAIDFQPETGDQATYTSQLAAWWLGNGLVGRCPGCNRYVLFAFQDKQCVADPNASGLIVLPDHWYQRAYIP